MRKNTKDFGFNYDLYTLVERFKPVRGLNRSLAGTIAIGVVRLKGTKTKGVAIRIDIDGDLTFIYATATDAVLIYSAIAEAAAIAGAEGKTNQ